MTKTEIVISAVTLKALSSYHVSSLQISRDDLFSVHSAGGCGLVVEGSIRIFKKGKVD